MKKSVALPLTAVVGGIIGLVVRHFYLATAFDNQQVGGLPIDGAPSRWVMLAVTAAVLIALCWQCRGWHKNFTRCFAGAFYSTSKPVHLGLMTGAALLVVGSFLNLSGLSTLANQGLSSLSYLARLTTYARIGAGIFGLLGAAGIWFITVKLRQKKNILSGWVAMPGLAFCFMGLSCYYESWGGDPVIGHFLIPMFAVVLSLLSFVSICAFAFEEKRAFTGLALVVCSAAAALCIASLGDELTLADIAFYLATVFYLLAMTSALAANDEKAPEAPVCASHCDQCVGCAPMGTLKKPEKKGKKKGKKGQQESSDTKTSDSEESASAPSQSEEKKGQA